MVLRLRAATVALLAALLFALLGCSGPRYEIWRSHDKQYASFGHAIFSVKKAFESSKPTPEEVEKATEQNWWGEVFSGGN